MQYSVCPYCFLSFVRSANCRTHILSTCPARRKDEDEDENEDEEEEEDFDDLCLPFPEESHFDFALQDEEEVADNVEENQEENHTTFPVGVANELLSPSANEELEQLVAFDNLKRRITVTDYEKLMNFRNTAFWQNLPKTDKTYQKRKRIRLQELGAPSVREANCKLANGDSIKIGRLCSISTTE
jgi:hypothetical protein